MKTFRIALLLLCSAALPAQSGRVQIRLIPQPNQTVHFKMQHEMDMELLVEAAADPSAEPVSTPMKMVGKSMFAFTQTMGAQSADGSLSTDLVYDQITFENSVNGKPVPLAVEVGNLIGKKVSIVFAKDGAIRSVTVPPDVDLPADTLKQMISSMYANLPKAALGIGESAKVPFSTSLPVPTPAGDPLELKGETTYTLASVETGADGQVARFNQSVAAGVVRQLEVDGESEKGLVSVNFTMKGQGGLRLNLSQGILTSGEMQTTLDGTMKMTGQTSGKVLQSVQVHGTTRMHASGRF